MKHLEHLIGISVINGVSKLQKEILTEKGKVFSYEIGARRYYKTSEIMKCLTLLKK